MYHLVARHCWFPVMLGNVRLSCCTCTCVSLEFIYQFPSRQDRLSTGCQYVLYRLRSRGFGSSLHVYEIPALCEVSTKVLHDRTG
jgi:hypothetical protein